METVHPSPLKVWVGFLACAKVSFLLVSATSSSCTLPGVFEREDAIVTCTFDRDISTLSLDFELRHFPINVSEFESEIVLSCHWKLKKLDCRSRPGYHLDSDVTNQFTVKISAVNRLNEGKYVCLVVPQHSGSNEFCELIIKVTISSCTAPAVLEKVDGAVTCTFANDIRNRGLDFELRHFPVNGSIEESETVISCYWKQRKHVCRNRPGYQLDSDVSHQFTVKIFEVNRRHAGKYACFEVPQGPGIIDYCELVVTGVQKVGQRSRRSLSESSVWDKNDSAFIPETIPETATSGSHKLPNSEDNEEKLEVSLIVLVVVSIGVMAFIIVMLCTLHFSWRKDSKHPQDQSLLGVGVNTSTNSPNFSDVICLKI